MEQSPMERWLEWFGNHSPDWLETLIRCTGIHNYLSTRTFTPFEKQFLANGLRFIPTPPISQTQLYINQYLDDETRGLPRFIRTLKNRLLYPIDDGSRISKFIISRKNQFDRYADENREEHFEQFRLLDQYQTATYRLLQQTLTTQSILQRSNCHHQDLTFIHRLIDDPDITCKPADKNLGLVLCDSSWYDYELGRMLKDRQTYQQVTGTSKHSLPTLIKQLKKSLKDELSKLVQRHRSDIEIWNPAAWEQVMKYMNDKIPLSSMSIPKIYLLIKVHKPKGLCGRPIVPCTNWITTPSSVLVDHLLQKVFKKANINWIVKDTKSFVNELEHTFLDVHDGIFVTADIASLYTNIDTPEGLKLIRQFLVEQSVPLNHIQLIMNLLSFVMNNSYLSFKDLIYKQIDGTAMGTACAPVYANIFVYMKERDVLSKFGTNIHLYRRYLDDIFGYISTDIAERFQTEMNQLHPKLVFEFQTHPTEAAFLDLLIHKGERFNTEGRFDLKVHQKKMNLYLYIPFQSFHTDAAKRSFIQTELMRYIRNSSNFQDYMVLKQLFYQRLRDRGYPHTFLRPVFNSIWYQDRKFFLHPSAELLSHPDLSTTPPKSQCLVKRLDRARLSSYQTLVLPQACMKSPPVFIIPYSPLSRLLSTRSILSQNWHFIHEGLNLPKPIIAYQSYPSLMSRLVFQKAKLMEERRFQQSQPNRSKQTTLSFQRVTQTSTSDTPITTTSTDGPSAMEICSE
jgi:hypothetical protein